VIALNECGHAEIAERKRDARNVAQFAGDGESLRQPLDRADKIPL
jgi:hypothetical protein